MTMKQSHRKNELARNINNCNSLRNKSIQLSLGVNPINFRKFAVDEVNLNIYFSNNSKKNDSVAI